jgi:hypothetical protein
MGHALIGAMRQALAAIEHADAVEHVCDSLIIRHAFVSVGICTACAFVVHGPTTIVSHRNDLANLDLASYVPITVDHLTTIVTLCCILAPSVRLRECHSECYGRALIKQASPHQQATAQ